MRKATDKRTLAQLRMIHFIQAKTIRELSSTKWSNKVYSWAKALSISSNDFCRKVTKTSWTWSSILSWKDRECKSRRLKHYSRKLHPIFCINRMAIQKDRRITFWILIYQLKTRRTLRISIQWWENSIVANMWKRSMLHTAKTLSRY